MYLDQYIIIENGELKLRYFRIEKLIKYKKTFMILHEPALHDHIDSMVLMPIRWLHYMLSYDYAQLLRTKFHGRKG